MKDILPLYVQFLRENYLQDFNTRLQIFLKEKKLSFLNRVPVDSVQYQEYVSRQNELFLIALEKGTAFERLQKRLKNLEEEKIPYYTKDLVTKDELFQALLIQRKTMIEFIPHYTDDPEKIIQLIRELDDYYDSASKMVVDTAFRIHEEVVVKTEEKFLRTAQNARDAIILTDQDVYVIFWNDAAEKMFGYTKEEMIGKPVTKIMPERFRKKHEKGIERFHKTGKGAAINNILELAGLRKDGTEFPIELSLSHWKQNYKLFFNGIIRDITNRKKMIREKELLYNITRQLGEATNLNDALKKTLKDICVYTGWKFGELHFLSDDGKHMIHSGIYCSKSKKLKPFIEGTLKSRFKPGEGLPGRAWQDGKAEWMKDVSDISEGYFVRKNVAEQVGLHAGLCVPVISGDEVFALMSFYMFEQKPEDKELVDVVSTLSNSIGTIIKRKKAEEELRNKEIFYHKMINEVNDYAFIRLDKNGYINDWNKGAEKIKGYKAKEILGRHFSIFYPENEKKKNKPGSLLKKAETEGRARYSGWRIRKEGSKFWGSVTLTALHNDEGKVDGFLKITRDMTEEFIYEEKLRLANEKLEQRVKERTKQLEKSNKELKDFAHIISHDLKTPLRGIGSLVHWLEEDATENMNRKAAGYLKLLKQRVYQMQKLMDSIYEYSRIGKQEVRTEQINGKILVDNVVNMINPDPKKFKIINKVNCRLYSQKLPLRQVLQNLISNAIKYMDKKLGVIEIGCTEKEKQWLFYVKDNGPGIEKRHHKKIFQIFQRLEKSDENTGVGLTLSLKFIQSLNGKLWLESEPGEGSVFYFTIPKKKHPVKERKETLA